MRERFWHEFWARVPSARKKQRPTFNAKDKYKKVPLPPIPELSYHNGKPQRLFVIFACVSNLTSTSQKHIPISIHNSLPSIHFPLDKGK